MPSTGWLPVAFGCIRPQSLGRKQFRRVARVELTEFQPLAEVEVSSGSQERKGLRLAAKVLAEVVERRPRPSEPPKTLGRMTGPDRGELEEGRS